MPRTILVHLNIEIDEENPYMSSPEHYYASAVGKEVAAAIEVGSEDPDQTPALADAVVTVALAEDIG